jgi:hypothetical protein
VRVILKSGLLENIISRLKVDFSDELVRFFSMVVLTRSTTGIVLKYVSLLAPIGTSPPPNFAQLLAALNGIAATALAQDRSVPFTNVFAPVSLTVDNAFVFLMWTKFPKMVPQYYPRLFAATDDEHHFFQAFVSLNRLHFSVDRETFRPSQFFRPELLPNQWLLIGIVLVQTEVQFYLNGTLSGIETLEEPFLFTGPSSWEFGGVLPQSLRVTVPAVVGPFLLCRSLPSAAIQQAAREDQRFLGRHQSNHLYSYQPYSSPPSNLFSFPCILVFELKMQVLIPLFRYLEQYSESDFISVIFDLFANLFLIGIPGEKAFWEGGGFAMVSQVLQELGPAALTFSLYLRFFGLVQYIATSDLLRQLVDSVIMNSRLWGRAAPTELWQIQSHWVTTVCPKCLDAVSALRPFSVFLTDMVLNFHDSADMSDDHPTDYQVNQVHGKSQQILYPILSFLAGVRFDAGDFDLLANYCIVSHSVPLVFSLLSALQTMANAVPSPLSVVSSETMRGVLYCLLRKESIDLAEKTLHIVFDLHEAKLLTGFSLEQDLSILARQIRPKIVTDHFFCRVRRMVLKYSPAFLSVCCWIALHLPPETRIGLFDGLQPGPVFGSESKLWLVWPIILAFHVQEAMRDQILFFLAQCLAGSWLDAILWIDLAAEWLRRAPCEMKSAFLTQIANLLQQSIVPLSHDIMTSFCKLVNFYFCFREAKYARTSLRPSRSMSEGESDFTRILSHIKVDAKTFVFSLRLNKQTHRWKDRPLVLRMLQILDQSPLDIAFQTRILYAYFLIRDAPDAAALAVLRGIEISDRFADEHQRLIDLLACACDSARIEGASVCRHASPDFRANGPKYIDELSHAAALATIADAELELAREMRHFSTSVNQVYKLAQAELSRGLLALSKSKQREFVSGYAWKEARHARNWHRLWISLIQANGPWANSSLTFNVRRDRVRCGMGVPMKLKTGPKKPRRDTADFGAGNCQRVLSSGVVPLIAEVGSGAISLKYTTKRDVFPCASIRHLAMTDIVSVPTGLELEFRNGVVVLLDFKVPASRDEFAKTMPAARRQRPVCHTSEWVSRSISNFQYLLELNRLAGRSFDNPSQYPIFPWVVGFAAPAKNNFRNLGALLRVDSSASFSSQLLVLGYLHGEKRIQSIPGMCDPVSNLPIQFPELAPEFFYFSEFLLAPDTILPKWAKGSPFEFIYGHRKALESGPVSEHLNKWIDLVFGCKQPQNERRLDAPVPIFDRPHPARAQPVFPQSRSLNLSLKLESATLVFAHVYQSTEKHICLVTVDSSNLCTKLVLPFKEGEPITEKGSSVVPNIEPKLRFVGCNGLLLISGLNTHLWDGEQTVVFPKHSRCLAADKHWIVSPGPDCMIYAFETSNAAAVARAIAYHGEKPCCACVNTRFHVFVVGTDGAGFTVCSLERGSSRITVGMPNSKIRRICVTPCLGFIVVYHTKIAEQRVTHMMSLFTINGSPVRAVPLDDEVTAMTAWTDRNGFDHIAIAGRNGLVFTAEAYYLKFTSAVVRSKTAIIELHYQKKARMLIGIAVDGNVICETIDA